MAAGETPYPELISTRPPGWAESYAAAFALLSLVAVLFTLHTYWSYAANGSPIPLARAAYWSASEWYTWAIVAPLPFRLAYPVSCAGRAGIAAGLLLVVVAAATQATLEWLLARAVVAVAGESTSIVSSLQRS